MSLFQVRDSSHCAEVEDSSKCEDVEDATWLVALKLVLSAEALRIDSSWQTRVALCQCIFEQMDLQRFPNAGTQILTEILRDRPSDVDRQTQVELVCVLVLACRGGLDSSEGAVIISRAAVDILSELAPLSDEEFREKAITRRLAVLCEMFSVPDVQKTRIENVPDLITALLSKGLNLNLPVGDSAAETLGMSLVRKLVGNCQLYEKKGDGLINAQVSGLLSARSSIKVGQGKAYFEARVLRDPPAPDERPRVSTSWLLVGWATVRFSPKPESVRKRRSLSQHCFLVCGSKQMKYSKGSKQDYGTGSWNLAKGDVVGCCLDLDEGAISFLHNGVALSTAFRLEAADVLSGFFPAFILGPQQGVDINLGERKFSCAVPYGYGSVLERQAAGDRGVAEILIFKQREAVWSQGLMLREDMAPVAEALASGMDLDADSVLDSQSQVTLNSVLYSQVTLKCAVCI